MNKIPLALTCDSSEENMCPSFVYGNLWPAMLSDAHCPHVPESLAPECHNRSVLTLVHCCKARWSISCVIAVPYVVPVIPLPS